MTDVLPAVLVDEVRQVPRFTPGGPALRYTFTTRFRPAADLLGDTRRLSVMTQQIGNGVPAPIEVSIVRPGTTQETVLPRTLAAAGPNGDVALGGAPRAAGVQHVGAAPRPPDQALADGGVLEPPPGAFDRVDFLFAEDDPDGTWTLLIKNRGPQAEDFRIRVRHPDLQVRLAETEIPFPLVRRLLGKVHRMMLPFVRIDSDVTVDFGAEFKKLTGLTRMRRHLGVIGELPGTGNDISLRDIRLAEADWDLGAGSPEALLLTLSASFETGGGAEIVIHHGPDLDLARLDLSARVEFDSLGFVYVEHRNLAGEVVRTRSPFGRLRAELSADVDVDTSLPGVQGRVRERVAGALRDALSSPDSRRGLAVAGEHFTDMLMFLATGNDDQVFYDVRPSATGIVVRHYPRPTERRRRDAAASVDAVAGVGLVAAVMAAGTGGGAGSSPGGGAGPRRSAGVQGPAGSHLVPATSATVAAGSGARPRPGRRAIEHVVVLMLENRSFDHMLGYLTRRRNRPDVDGLGAPANHTNPVPGSTERVGVFRLGAGDDISVDPAHGVSAVSEQVAGGAMSGFVASYLRRAAIRRNPGSERKVMGFYDDAVLGVYDRLAEQYLVCNRWFCSHPGPTYPNRFIAVTGSAPQIDNFDVEDRQAGAVRTDTIFDVLSEGGVSWKYVESNISFLRMFDRYRINETDIIQRADWLALARGGQLPAVSWLDPNIGDLELHADADDDHPPSDVANGQKLVQTVYDALTADRDQWAKTLFVVTYDEHGGFYDHVAPHGLDGADDPVVHKIHEDGASFYGPRVPTIVISPWVRAGSSSDVVFDHTSILKTILVNFLGPEAARQERLGKRVDAANDLLALLEPRPRADVPQVATPLLAAVPRPRAASSAEALPVERDSFHLGMRLFGLGPKLRRVVGEHADG